jgi:hypothetical protein
VGKGFFYFYYRDQSGTEENMRGNKKLLLPLLAVGIMAVLAAVMFMIYLHFKPETTQGSKNIEVEVVIPDQDTKVFTLHTDAEYLSQALQEENLIKGTNESYGLFITEVNGRAADDSKQEWWCITKSGEDVLTGADQTPITDGDHYEITLKAGY